jgi:hypothetical protein
MARRTPTVSVRVIEQVADATDSDPSELPPLYNDIDPDALNALVKHMTHGEISFTYAGQEITVASSGHIRLEDHSSGTRSAETAVYNQ